MVEQKVLQDFVDGLKPDEKEVNDIHTAIVSRIDDEGVVWVNINGSDKETPTELVATEVKRGDAVTVQWRNNKLYIASNYTNPSAGVVRVSAVEAAAQTANTAANNAVADAGRAREAAEDAIATAESVHGIAEQAAEDAADAKQSATNASEYAARALGNLSTVQSVAETLNWITQHGTMTLTTDTALDPTHVYFVRDNNGDYEVGSYRYSVVTEPDVADISTYYELSIDESLNNYVGTHLAVTSEGLWILPEGLSASSYKILIATGGQGHTYPVAGTYIIDSTGKSVAKLGEVITLGIDDESHLDMDYHSMQLVDKEGEIYFFASDLRDENGVHLVTERYTGDGSNISFLITFEAYSITSVTVDGVSKDYRYNRNIIWIEPAPADKADIEISYVSKDRRLKAYTLGLRKNNSVIGGMSVAEGYDTTASGIYSHAEGYDTTSSGRYAHAEGVSSEASGEASHAEGISASASGGNSHAEGDHTEASGEDSHAEGSFTEASGARSHAEGKFSNAGGEDAHAEGYNTEASGRASHTEGSYSEASDEASHAEGRSSIASGNAAHAEGYYTEANGRFSHAQNQGTIAAKESQTAIGEYNKEDTETLKSKQKALIIGNGTNSLNRSDALTVDWGGNVWTAGTITENNGTRDIDLNISEATITKYVNLGMSLT